MSKAVMAGMAALAITAFAGTSIAGDRTFSAAELSRFIPGKSITFRSGTANYYKGGGYVYRLGAQRFRGKWYLSGSKVCINFGNGRKRCDRYGKDGKSYFLINGRGGRRQIYGVKRN